MRELIPNQTVLLRSLILQEARLRSEIENIVTTNDRLYRAFADENDTDPQTREVLNYQEAVWYGYTHLREGGIINLRLFQDIVRIIKRIQ